MSKEVETFKAMRLAANGNRAAEEYLRLIAMVARMIDDLEDQDHGQVEIGRLAHLLLVELPRNPFFCAHAATLVGIHDMAINAWQDANVIERAGETPAGRIWADLINEVALVVAGLTGGYDYRRQVSLTIRQALYWPEESAGREVTGRLAETRHLKPNT